MLELAARVNQTVGSLAVDVLSQAVIREIQSDVYPTLNPQKPRMVSRPLDAGLAMVGKAFKPGRSVSTPVRSIRGEVSCRLAHAGTEH